MFQPQPTPFSSSFAPYGVAPSPSSPQFPPGFQACPGGLIADSGGPTFVRDPVFSPVSVGTSARSTISGAPLAFGATYNKMADHDLEAQEALARDFHPALEVSTSTGSLLCATGVARTARADGRTTQGPLVGEKRSSHAITEEYAKADPVYVAKTAVSERREGLRGWQRCVC
jgi:hypothetical protein